MKSSFKILKFFVWVSRLGTRVSQTRQRAWAPPKRPIRRSDRTSLGGRDWRCSYTYFL